VNGIQLVYVPSIEQKTLSQLTHTLLATLHACLFKRPDVLFYVNAANGPFGVITRLFKIPTVINVDGMEWLRPKWKGLGSKYFYFAAKQATRWMDQVVTDAAEMQKTYLELFQAKSTMIAYGADPYIPVSMELLDPWNLESGGYFLIVGRLIPDNNSDILIDGYLKSKSDKMLVIVGDDVFNDVFAQSIKEKIKGNPNIRFTGYVKDSQVLSALYQHCYAYLHGHEFGGTNPTLIKALAEGTGIIALGTRFNKEVLADGEFGLLFDKDPNSLVKCLNEKNQVFVDLRAKAQSRLIETYNWDHIASQYERIFVNSQHEGNL
jgi:glycosyltransferase involved in cell wall biosynthesis